MVAASMVLAAAGDLTGNWSWTVWLLIPLVAVLAVVTARAVGPRGDPPRTQTASRGVSAHLARTATEQGGSTRTAG
jgi:membrane protein implicated in regulation of membrane protease activity